MSEPFIGEIKIFGGNYAIYKYAFCNGQILNISQNSALYAILGTAYGGNGTSTFGLPNLQGRAPMHWGNGPGLSQYDVGEVSGSSTVTLLQTELPQHSHSLQALSDEADSASPTGALTGVVPPQPSLPIYGPSTSPTTMATNAIGSAGGSQPHNNKQPYLALNFLIALQGLFPSRS